MELKLGEAKARKLRIFRLNRTFMELKREENF